MAQIKQAMEKKVQGMRSQTMSFANEGIEVSLSIPDTTDVKEAFGSVIETVVEQHEDIGKLNDGLDKVSEEGRQSRKKIAEVTTDKLKQVISYQLQLEKQLQAAQRNIRNFAYNIQGYIDENDSETSAMGNGAQVLKDIEVKATDISGDSANALFPTEDGAEPSSHVSFQSAGKTVSHEDKPKKHRLPGVTNVDYHAVPAFVLPSDVRARWRWAIKKTMQGIRRKQQKISFTRTRVDKAQTVVGRLDAIDSELCRLPEQFDKKLTQSIDAVREFVDVQTKSLQEHIDEQAQRAAAESEANAAKFAALDEIITVLQQQQTGKLAELEEKMEQNQQRVDADIALLQTQLGDLIALQRTQIEKSLQSVFKTLVTLEQQATALAQSVEQNVQASQHMESGASAKAFNDLLKDNSMIQDLQVQLGVVEGSLNVTQQSLLQIAGEISAVQQHISSEQSHPCSKVELTKLQSLLFQGKGFDEQAKTIRQSVNKMKEMLVVHHNIFREVTADIVVKSADVLAVLPSLQSDLKDIQGTQTKINATLGEANESKKQLQQQVEQMQLCLSNVEKTSKANAEQLVATQSQLGAVQASQQAAADSLAQLAAKGSTRPNVIEAPANGQVDRLRDELSEAPSNVVPGEVTRAIAMLGDDLSAVRTDLESVRQIVLRQAMALRKQSTANSLRQEPSSSVHKLIVPREEKEPPQPASTMSENVDSPNVIQSATEPSTTNDDEKPMASVADVEKEDGGAAEDANDLQSYHIIDDSTIAEEEVGVDELGFGDDDLLALTFPTDKVKEQVVAVLRTMLPEYLAAMAPVVPHTPARLQPQASSNSLVLPDTSQRVALALQQSRSATPNTTRGAGRNGLAESFTASALDDGSPKRTLFRQNTDNKSLVGSFVDYNIRSSFLGLPPAENSFSATMNNSEPLLADIAAIRTDTRNMQRKLAELEQEKLSSGQAQDIIDGLMREQRRKDAKTDHKLIIEDMDQTVRELVKELINMKRSHDTDVQKLREDFDIALGKAFKNALLLEEGSKDALATTKALCLACGRGSAIRSDAVSRPSSPSFLPQLGAHSLPGPEVYRAGFRIPVRASSPPLTEIPLIMRGKLTSAEASSLRGRSIDSVEIGPSVTSVHFPHHGTEITDDFAPDLNIGISDEPSMFTHNNDHDSGGPALERSSTVTIELPKLQVTSMLPQQTVLPDNIRPIFRKGFPARKPNMKVETTYAPERFDVRPSSKSSKTMPKPLMSASLSSLQ